MYPLLKCGGKRLIKCRFRVQQQAPELEVRLSPVVTCVCSPWLACHLTISVKTATLSLGQSHLAEVAWPTGQAQNQTCSCINCYLNVEHLLTKESAGASTLSISCAAGSGLLAANYLTAITLALRMQHAFRVPLMVGANVLFCIYLWLETARVDAAKYSQPAIAAYYRGIWNLFYAQYAVLPFI